MGERARLHAIVKGKVQGVGFRYFTLQRATELRLVGYVRNRLDRSVEVVAEGERQALETLVEHLRAGPRAATVTDVIVNYSPATGEFRDFRPRF